MISPPCHTRESGDPDSQTKTLDSRFRGNDNGAVLGVICQSQVTSTFTRSNCYAF